MSATGKRRSADGSQPQRGCTVKAASEPLLRGTHSLEDKSSILPRHWCQIEAAGMRPVTSDRLARVGSRDPCLRCFASEGQAGFPRPSRPLLPASRVSHSTVAFHQGGQSSSTLPSVLTPWPLYPLLAPSWASCVIACGPPRQGHTSSRGSSWWGTYWEGQIALGLLDPDADQELLLLVPRCCAAHSAVKGGARWPSRSSLAVGTASA